MAAYVIVLYCNLCIYSYTSAVVISCLEFLSLVMCSVRLIMCFRFVYNIFTFRSRVVLACHVFSFLHLSLRPYLLVLTFHVHTVRILFTYILHIFHFTQESSPRVLEYGSKKNIAKNRLYYVSAVSEGSFGVQRS